MSQFSLYASRFVVLFVVALTAPSYAVTNFYSDQASWQTAAEAEAGSVQEFQTTAINVALANEVTAPPTGNQSLGNFLTFSAANAGTCAAFTLSTPDVDTSSPLAIDGFIFEDNELSSPRVLSMGDVNNFEDDDVTVTITDGKVHALGFYIYQNGSSTGETIVVNGNSGVLFTVTTVPTNLDQFVGFVADEPIISVVFDEGAGGDDVGMRDVSFAPSVSADTDTDGMLDCFEILNGFNPNLISDAALDADSDGLSNLDEQTAGTDPNDDDSDNDGLLDGFEITFGFDPLGANEASLDGDSDGLDNLSEQTAGTDPADDDSDNDGLLDGAEVNTHLTNPLDDDSDDDGLSDGAEVNTHSTNPVLADSDSDGLSDGDEINTHLTNPLDDDSDDDGLLDGAEINTHSTNPLVADTDNDGLSDGDEVNVHTTDPTDTDSDNDGFNDGAEIQFGTDPNQAIDNPLQAKLTASDGASSDSFGRSVAISGDTAVIGAHEDDDNGSRSGSAYVYVRSGGVWTEQQKLTASDGAADDIFGYSVAIDGDTVIIGAVLDDDNGSGSGSAYVYARSGCPGACVWTEQQKLTASDGAADDDFGFSAAISGDTLVVGAYQDDDNGSNSGSAYVYARSGGVWTEQQKLTASDGAAGDDFGYSVAISSDTLVVGAYQDDDNGSRSGSAYVYVRDAGVWAEQQKLTASDGFLFDQFGSSVAISGDSIVIGADEDDDNGSDSGSAYVYVRSGCPASCVWTEQQKLTAGDGAADDEFGWSVAISGDTLVVGAYQDDDNGSNSGSAYVYTLSGGVWIEQQKLTASDGAANDFFGFSVAVSGDTAVIGAYQHDDNGTNSGSAYALDLDIDNDGLLNGFELTYGFDPLAAGEAALDGDSDGLNNLAEQAAGANPTLNDSDSDGLIDGAEVNVHGTSPAAADTDGDGLSDGDEINTYLTDPLASDSDGDGLTDGDEIALHITDPNDSDSDGDGFNDGIEVITGTNPNLASSVPLELKQTASDGASGDQFGFRVAISGDTAVIGAAGDDDNGSGSGSAYVYVRSGGAWMEQQKLTASDGAASDNFGYSVSISGDTVVIGAIADDDNGSSSGSAYVYSRSGGVWAEQQKLTASDATAGDSFGFSVAVSGDTAVIGARSDDDNGGNSGSAYVFVRSGGVWIEQQKLAASDIVGGDEFGFSVAVEGNTTIVGARLDDDNGTASGSAYVYTRSGGVWTEQQKLTANDGAFGDQFAYSVAISGDSVVIGAYQDDDNGDNSGSAYVYVRSGCPGACVWTEQQKLVAGDGAADDGFGWSVTISADTVVIGAVGDDDNGSVSGSAYVYTRGGGVWTEQQKLTASDGAASDQFGHSVAISGDTAMIGALGDDDNGSVSGSTYAYDFDFDNDGLLNFFETSFGFDPFAAGEASLDGDSDGLDNLAEQAAGTNPTLNDSDSDGLLDGAEVNVHATDPIAADTDSDGLDDGDEINVYASDPLDGDSDSDGLLDGAEVATHSTSPTLSDTDSDGLNDGFEVQFGFDPTGLNESALDGDSDGLDNLDEQAAGSDPLNNDSDSDTLLDGAEVNTYGTSPIDSDSDDDGLLDGFEIQFGFDPLGTDESALDGDVDGLDNLGEQAALTDPADPDSDDDGLSDGDEVNVHGTDPNDTDTDDDLLLDAFEVANGLDPVNTDESLNDEDGDGLNNLGEQAAGTSAVQNDSDGDGILDGAEVADGWDPLSNDRDNDGLTADEELALGTDPLLADSDMDGLPDGQEVSDGTDPLAPDNMDKQVPVSPIWVLVLAMGLFGLIALPRKNQRLSSGS